MLFDKANAGELRPWLVQTLEPICDADPEVLTDYVLALMQHDASEDQLQKMFVEQLHDFLEQEAAPFVDKLFQALRTKSYLTPAEGVKPTPTASKSPSPPSQPQVQTSSTSDDIAIPIPSSSQSNHPYASPIPTEPRGRKRNLDNDDEYQLNVRPKGPRIGDDHASRYGNGRGSMNAERSTPSSRGGMIGQNGRSKGICYNYHNHGYCARGALCPYSHGDDPITANSMPFQHQQQPGQPGPVPFPPPILGMIPPNMLSMLMQGQGGGYDPMQAHMDLSNGGRRSGGGFRRNQDRDEDSVMIDVTPNQVPQPIIKPLDGSSMNQAGAMDGVVMANHVPIQNGPLANQGGSINGHVTPPFSGRGRGMSRRGGHGRGGPPERGGTFNGDHSNFPPIDPSTNGPGQGRTDKTLVVERIPAEKLNLAAVNDYFKNFGTVTNVAIDAKSSKALVSFETHEQAYAAWKSEDAVLGNRFVKLFWHRPMEGQGGTGTKLLAASAPLMKNLAAQASQSTSTPPSSSIPSASLTKQPAKLSLLQLQINEQKSLLAKVATATPEEKKVIMARLRKLDEEMKAPTSATAGNGFTSTRNGVDSAMSEKERLDKELAEMQGDSEMTDATSNENSGGNESLQAKVARLRAEAASLGIDPLNPSAGAHSPQSYRGFTPRGRGRGRGRGAPMYYRGGGPARSSMKLDLRPRKLLVKGVPSGTEGEAKAKEWFESAGDVESFSVLTNGDMLVAFRTRPAAEHALSKGTNIAGVGSVQISWHADSSPTAPSALKSNDASLSTSEVVDASSSGAFDSPSLHEYGFDVASVEASQDHDEYNADDSASAW